MQINLTLDVLELTRENSRRIWRISRGLTADLSMRIRINLFSREKLRIFRSSVVCSFLDIVSCLKKCITQVTTMMRERERMKTSSFFSILITFFRLFSFASANITSVFPYHPVYTTKQ